MAFQQATTISTSASTLTLDPAGDLSLDAGAGSQIRLNDAQADVDVVIESASGDNLFKADAARGSVGINAGADGHFLFRVGGTFTSDGDSTEAIGLMMDGTLIGHSGDSARVATVRLSGSTQINGNATHVAQLYVDEPDITETSGNVTNASTIYVSGAPTEGTNNYALFVDGGTSRFDGDIEHTNATNTWKWERSGANLRLYGAGNQFMELTSGGMMLIDDTANANMTVGLTINQGANSDQIFALKTTTGSFNTGLTTAVFGNDVETDDFFTIEKNDGNLGGTTIHTMGEDAALTTTLEVQAYGGTANTSKTTSGAGLIQFTIAEHDGANALTDITADGNVFSIRARVGAANVTRFLIDEDGDMYSVVAGQTFDEYDDAHLVRALDVARGDTIETEWDSFVQYNEQALVDTGVLGAPVSEGGMLNVTQLQRLHNGAIWQGYTRQMELKERIDKLEQLLLREKN